MIYDFEMAWDANKAQLLDYFRTNSDEHPSYEDLVKLLFDYVVNPYLEENGREVYNTNLIHEIDDGCEQGTMLYLIPIDTEEPACHEYVITYVNYGDDATCDSLQLIQMHQNSKGFEGNVIVAYTMLCHHILKKCKIPYLD